RNKEIEQLLTENELFVLDLIILSQSVKHSPFRVVIKGTIRKNISTSTASISICDEHQQYTKSFVDLLKDYYLYL
ncbi:MAG TPA: hypothetical protein VL095_06585, partial [Flavisolibacter sp.]|nr:hypothetical protein [Flavisolibacter sp.]